MGLYKIIHREQLIGEYYVEASDEQEALNVWEAMICNGDVDFSDMEMIDSSDEAVLDDSEWEAY